MPEPVTLPAGGASAGGAAEPVAVAAPSAPVGGAANTKADGGSPPIVAASPAFNA